MTDEQQLLRFAGKALGTAYQEHGDWDGGDCQDAMEECGLIAPHHVTKSCRTEEVECQCTEFGFPTTCFRMTELGRRAVASLKRGDTET